MKVKILPTVAWFEWIGATYLPGSVLEIPNGQFRKEFMEVVDAEKAVTAEPVVTVSKPEPRKVQETSEEEKQHPKARRIGIVNL